MAKWTWMLAGDGETHRADSMEAAVTAARAALREIADDPEDKITWYPPSETADHGWLLLAGRTYVQDAYVCPPATDARLDEVAP